MNNFIGVGIISPKIFVCVGLPPDFFFDKLRNF